MKLSSSSGDSETRERKSIYAKRDNERDKRIGRRLVGENDMKKKSKGEGEAE